VAQPHVPAQPGWPVPPPGGTAPAHFPASGYGVPQPGAPAFPQWQPLAPNGARLADFGQRLGAYVIDVLIVSAAWIPIVVIATVSSIVFLDQRAASDAAFALGLFGLWGFGLLVLFAAYYVYLVEMMFRTGQTIGKRIMNIRIVPVDPGATLTRAMAARRWLVEIPGGLLLSCVAFAYIDGLWQLWDKPYRQCLHDKFAQTAVVRVAP
jgi:uncharacterized RDD family membrane protein YckC